MTIQPVALRAPEVRTFGAALQVRDVASNLRELTGRAVPYGEKQNVGWYIESWKRGAFSKSIREAASRLPLLLWHDAQAFPVGMAREWDDTAAGLDGLWELADTELAQQAARQARDGFLTGLSVGFQLMPNGSRWTLVSDDEWDPSAGVVDEVERTEARLLETSLTPTPAFQGAQVTLVRSADVPREARARWKGLGRPTGVQEWRSILDTLKLPERGV